MTVHHCNVRVRSYESEGLFELFCPFLTLFDRKISRNFPHHRGRGDPGGVEKIHTFFKASLIQVSVVCKDVGTGVRMEQYSGFSIPPQTPLNF